MDIYRGKSGGEIASAAQTRTGADHGVAVAVVGPGAVGTTLAHQLRRPGASVTLCSRRPINALEVVDATGTVTPVDVPIVMDPSDLAEPPAFVFIALKAHHLEGAASWLRAFDRHGTTFVILMNGVEQTDLVAPYVSSSPAVPAVVWCRSETVTPSRVLVRSAIRLALPDVAEAHAVEQLLDQTQVGVELAADFVTTLWDKLVRNAVSGLEALALRRADMFTIDAVRDLGLRYARECIVVARAEGADLADDLADSVVGTLAERGRNAGTSILYDRLAGSRLEWDIRNGVIQRHGRRHGIATPISDVVVPLLRAASGEDLAPDPRRPGLLGLPPST